MKQKVLSLFDDFYSYIGENNFCRSLSAISLFDFFERLRKENFPLNWYNLLEKEFSKLITFFDFFNESFETSFMSQNSGFNKTPTGDIQWETGEVYYQLWKDFKNEEYYLQSFNMLVERFKKNNISLDGVKLALDDGCGGGRYTLALKKIGCPSLIGVDVSQNSIAHARKMNPYAKNEVNFLTSSVLNLPFKNEIFDFVFSNGVLHHTHDTKKGLHEIYRVLKKGMPCWIYLYGGKGSFFWDTVDYCRKLLSNVPQGYTQVIMKLLGYPPGRIFHRCDFFYVPIQNRYFQSEVERMISNAGFGRFRRLQRGVGYDWDEILHKNPNIDPYIYGEGEMRYILYK